MRINELINQSINDHSLGGANLLVIKNGKVLLDESFGSDKNNAIYQLYSMTKIMTSIAIFKLYEEDKISLNEPLSTFFPSFKYHQYFNQDGNLTLTKKQITIQHLLNMTAGMPYPGDTTPAEKQMKLFEQQIINQNKSGETLSTKDVISKMAAVPGDFEPGSSWAYGVSADILGGVIEVVTNMSLDEYFKEKIIDPLGMIDTGFTVPLDKISRVSGIFKRNPYSQYTVKLNREVLTHQDNNQLTVPLTPNIHSVESAFLSAGGGLYSTTHDFIKVLELLLNDGIYESTRLLSKKTVELMTKDQLPIDVQKSIVKHPVGHGLSGYSYSNLLRILVSPDRSDVLGVNGHVGEFGWDGAGGNFGLVDPHNNVTAIFMMQDLSGAEPILRRSIYQEIMNITAE